MKARNIGIEVTPPKNECEDPKCCWHGTVPVRGKIFKGKVVSAKALKTAIISRDYLHPLPKYERLERRTSRIVAYNPECISAKENDTVTIAECRPISKTKHFIIVERMGQ